MPADASPPDRAAGPVRVFLVEPHAMVRDGLRHALAREPDLSVVGEASTAEDAVSRVGLVRPQVVIIDSRVEESGGSEVCRRVKERSPDTACLLLTSVVDEELQERARRAGASGMVLKRINGNGLSAAVRAAAAGKQLFFEEPSPRAARAQRDGEGALGRLTRQERRILDLLGDGLTNREIAEQLYLSPKTVKNYVSAVLSKLGFTRRTQAAVFLSRVTAEGGGGLDDVGPARAP